MLMTVTEGVDLQRVGRVRLLAASGGARAIRESNRIGLRELCRLIDVPAPNLSRWERGLAVPPIDAALRWADTLERLGAKL